MNDTPEKSAAAKQPQFRFSIGTLLLLTSVACLTAKTVVSSRRVAMLEQKMESQNRELDALCPLPVQEVARQFEKSATLGSISTSVKDVRYSPETDKYKVDFSWTDSTTKKTWHTDTTLQSDGYGTYYGQIRSGQFIKPLGYEDSFTVAVKSPSALGRQTGG